MAEQWKEEHDKIYGDLPDPGPMKFLPKPERFPQVRVSVTSAELVADFEQAYQRLSIAEGREEIDAAYGALCQRRKELYEALSTLDRLTGMPTPVAFRFN